MIHRRLLVMASVVSLLLCLLTAALWVRSYCRTQWWVWRLTEVGGIHEIGYGRGRLYYVRSDGYFGALHTFSDSDSDLASPWSMRDFRINREEWQLGGFDIMFSGYPMVYVPFWSLLIATGLISALSYRRARRRRLGGHCAHCDYNLTGNTSGVCPECGATLPKRDGATA